MLTFLKDILKPVFNHEKYSKRLWYLTPCHLTAFMKILTAWQNFAICRCACKSFNRNLILSLKTRRDLRQKSFEGTLQSDHSTEESNPLHLPTEPLEIISKINRIANSRKSACHEKVCP
jgi:hypothetical protein